MRSFIPDIILPTTVVGSFPVVVPKGLRGIFGDRMGFASRYAISRQVEAGITIISDGQVRGEMIEAFTRDLPGCRGREVIGKISPPDGFVSIKDTRYALTKHPYVKGIVTGPTTISYGLSLNTPLYRNKGELVPDIATALVHEAQALSRLGISMLQIDEPLFSTGVADLVIGREAIQTLTAGITVPVCLHACGNIAPFIDDIIKMPVQIIDIEGTENPELLTTLSKNDIADRWIGFGCVSSSDPHIEDTSLVIDRIRKAVEIIPPGQLLLDPDCGLRMLSFDIAFQKLQSLTTAADVVRKEL
ncbi:MAG: methionine synthase [Methanospirillaceae archaeon]|nr:methionine synthase [Methanospirillaceae archaeon]